MSVRIAPGANHRRHSAEAGPPFIKARSSSGPGPHSFKVQITGSNPVRAPTLCQFADILQVRVLGPVTVTPVG